MTRKPLLWLTMLLLCLVGTALAEQTAWRSPLQVEGTTAIDVPTAAKLHAEGIPFVDVRNPRLFKRKHIPGAHHLDLKDGYSREALAQIVAPEQPLVLYCSGAKCSRSSKAATLAVSWGYKKIYYFREGVVGWKLAGLPMKFADGSVRPVDQSGQ